MSGAAWTHDPDARLRYGVDWSAWLVDGDTITAVDVDVAEGDVVIDSTGHDDTRTTAVISGGTDGGTARVRFRATTAAGWIDDRTITLYVRHR